jgi:hypothetical protein
MYIRKIQASDGSVVWKMSYASTTSSTNSGAETVAFTSDGGFVVGGFLNSIYPLNEIYFKSGG